MSPDREKKRRDELVEASKVKRSPELPGGQASGAEAVISLEAAVDMLTEFAGAGEMWEP